MRRYSRPRRGGVGRYASRGLSPFSARGKWGLSPSAPRRTLEIRMTNSSLINGTTSCKSKPSRLPVRNHQLFSATRPGDGGPCQANPGRNPPEVARSRARGSRSAQLPKSVWFRPRVVLGWTQTLARAGATVGSPWPFSNSPKSPRRRLPYCSRKAKRTGINTGHCGRPRKLPSSSSGPEQPKK